MLEQMKAGLSDDLNPQPAILALTEALKSINHLCHSKQVQQVAECTLDMYEAEMKALQCSQTSPISVHNRVYLLLLEQMAMSLCLL